MAKTYEVTNRGPREQAIFVEGLTKTVKPGKSITIENYKLTDDMAEHYKARGVTFAEPGGKARKSKAKGKAADDHQAAIDAAQKAVDDAEAALAEAGDDDARKAVAEAALANAEAALAKLDSE